MVLHASDQALVQANQYAPHCGQLWQGVCQHPFEPVLQALALMRSYTIDGAVQSQSKTRAFSCCIGSAGIADA